MVGHGYTLVPAKEETGAPISMTSTMALMPKGINQSLVSHIMCIRTTSRSRTL
jgi:hypothetical protein